jgi:hypothetical protein
MDWENLRKNLVDGLNESPLLDRQFYGNAVLAWLVAAGVFVAAWLLLRLVLGVTRRRAEKLAETHKYYLAHFYFSFPTRLLPLCGGWWSPRCCCKSPSGPTC